MIYYRIASGEVFAFEADGSQDGFIPRGAVRMDDAEVSFHLNPPPIMEEAHAKAMTGVDDWRTRQENTEVTFELSGRTWDAGLKSQTRIEPLLKLKQLPDGFFWTDHDNNDVPVAMEELRAIGDAMNEAIVARGFAIHARQRQMKAELEDMTAEELMAFVPGWPDEQA